MYDYQEGAKSASLCASCNKKVPVTLTKETLSFCEGLEEVDDVLVYICDVCGNMCSIPAESLLPIQQTIQKLLQSKLVATADDITVELKTLVERKQGLGKESAQNLQEDYSLVAAAR